MEKICSLLRNVNLSVQHIIVKPPESQKSPQGSLKPPQGSLTSPQGNLTSPQGSLTSPQGSLKSPQESLKSPSMYCAQNHLNKNIYNIYSSVSILYMCFVGSIFKSSLLKCLDYKLNILICIVVG